MDFYSAQGVALVLHFRFPVGHPLGIFSLSFSYLIFLKSGRKEGSEGRKE
jgi:hypothetical protein